MTDTEITEEVFPEPTNDGMLSNQEIMFGPAIPAIDRLSIFSPDQFENMVREWVTGFLIPKGLYKSCKKCSGAGDMGRDVIAFVDENIWDNYQCKHYDGPLSPSGMNSELGKLVYYTFHKKFTLPRKYYFVSPKGAGPKLNQLLEKPDELKKQLIDNWDSHCREKIRSNNKVDLNNELLEYLNSIDFSIFISYDPQQLIEEHAKTTHYASRFGGGLTKRRDVKVDTPSIIQGIESEYISQLFAAYSEFTKKPIKSSEDLSIYSELEKHFTRQRLGFYSADSLNQFSRDTLPPDVDYFEDLKCEFHTGVIDVVENTYNNGYERVKATTNFAKGLAITHSPLVSQLRVDDRVGICHHLANEKKILWVAGK